MTFVKVENVVCTVCESLASTLAVAGLQDFEYGISGTYALRQCDSCKQIFLSPRPIEKDLVACYPDSYHGYQTKAMSVLYTFLADLQMKRRFRMQNRLLSDNAHILDVGCGDGYILKKMKCWKPTWHMYGIEFNGEATETDRPTEYELFEGVLEDYKKSPGTFDLIIMNHLIEHLPNPVRTLKKAAVLLKTGGYIIGEVPNYDSWDRRLTGRYWGGHHTPRHLFQFTPTSLGALFQRIDLDTIHIGSELHTGHWAASIQNYLQDTRFSTRLHNGRAWYYPFLLAVFIPLNFIQSFYRKTGIMSFIAKKSSNS